MSLVGRLKASLQFRIDGAADRAAARVAADVTAQVQRDMHELQRILRQQGDAADELAETFGRTLLRLSAEVDSLREALSGGDGRARTLANPEQP